MGELPPKCRRRPDGALPRAWQTVRPMAAVTATARAGRGAPAAGPRDALPHDRCIRHGWSLVDGGLHPSDNGPLGTAPRLPSSDGRGQSRVVTEGLAMSRKANGRLGAITAVLFTTVVAPV